MIFIFLQQTSEPQKKKFLSNEIKFLIVTTLTETNIDKFSDK